MLEFQDGARCILGADVGASHVGVALTDLRGELLAWEERPHPVRADPHGTTALVIALAEACLARAGRGAGQLVGIGVAMPSPVEPRAPHGLSRRVLPAWGGRCGLEALRARFGVPALVDNDANLGALAEWRWGAGRGLEDLAFVKVGTGVGCGLVIGGRIHRGAGGFAGELGHRPLEPAGPACLCGVRGCLETLVGAQAIVARARALLREGRPSALRGREPSARDVEDAARGGDPLALEVVGEAAERLGAAVAGVLNVLDPAMEVLGGGLTRAGLPLLQPLRAAARARTLATTSSCEVVLTPLGAPGVALGAAALVLEAALAEPRAFFLGARA
jgi:predicted NBD/HSP70 family sugar kinase